MTTKMIATRGDGVMPCCVVLLLLLLGVPSAQTQCVDNVTECATLLTNIGPVLATLVKPSSNATALETECSSVRQNVTDCLREANESCSGQPDMLGTLADLMTSFDSFCAPGALICHRNASACQAAMLEVLPSGRNAFKTTKEVEMLEELCPSVRQNVTDCVREANEACSGQPNTLRILTDLLASMDSLCGPAMICLLKATACQVRMLDAVPADPPPWNESATTTNVEMLQQLCPMYRQTSQCLRDLTATDDCGEMEELKNLTSSVAIAAPSCTDGTGKWCPQSFGCISAFLHAVDAGGECTSLPTYVSCLNDLNGTCTFNESNITMTDLQSLMTSTCSEMAKYPAEYQNCSAWGRCGDNSATVGQLTRASDESVSAIEALFAMANLLNDPAFLCSYVQVMVDCAVSQAGTCGYTDQYVIAMTAQQQSIHPKCPNTGYNAGQNTEVGRDTESGGERSSGHALHWVLTAVTSVTAALQFGL